LDPIGCPETSVRNYHYSLRNDPEERGSFQIEIGLCGSGFPCHFISASWMERRFALNVLPNISVCGSEDSCYWVLAGEKIREM
jgi:hypothetical protein